MYDSSVSIFKLSRSNAEKVIRQEISKNYRSLVIRNEDDKENATSKVEEIICTKKKLEDQLKQTRKNQAIYR